MLAWDKTKPCPQISGLGEATGIADRCDQRGGVEHPDSGDGCQTPGGGIIAGKFNKLGVQALDFLVEVSPFCTKIADEPANSRGQPCLPLKEQSINTEFQLAATNRKNRAALQHDGAQLVDQAPALSHQTGPDAVKGVDI
ncbi:hypothetical protein MBENS4_3232 [Novosphingobium sp. MBES04]|nr:hypothetical protein MBENS4_3232 [Novosphingobium sp. MBES04]